MKMRYKKFSLDKSVPNMSIAIKLKHANVSQVKDVTAVVIMYVTYNFSGVHEWIFASK